MTCTVSLIRLSLPFVNSPRRESGRRGVVSLLPTVNTQFCVGVPVKHQPPISTDDVAVINAQRSTGVALLLVPEVRDKVVFLSELLFDGRPGHNVRDFEQVTNRRRSTSLLRGLRVIAIDLARGDGLSDLRCRCHIHNAFLFRFLAPRSSFKNYLGGAAFGDLRSFRILLQLSGGYLGLFGRQSKLAVNPSSQSGQARSHAKLAVRPSSQSGQARSQAKLAVRPSSQSGQARSQTKLAVNPSSQSVQARSQSKLAVRPSSQSVQAQYGCANFGPIVVWLW
ncbi:hypothetical protein LSAT2_018905 [Lamellibrachia satsuma]|nr:hypothetical protein LSAT2_018905 [Lamellibrachia satsuma]